MARAHRSLSPTVSSLFAGEHKITPSLSEHKAEHGSKVDLEDGEIADELKAEEAKAGADAGVPISSAKIGPATSPMPSNPAPEENQPSPAAAAEIETPDPPFSHLGSETLVPDHETLSVLGSETPLSPEELDLAKNIVLDLLGWGVQPEYLIECGVSSHAIYRIFTDLHLRLPSNLSYFG